MMMAMNPSSAELCSEVSFWGSKIDVVELIWRGPGGEGVKSSILGLWEIRPLTCCAHNKFSRKLPFWEGCAKSENSTPSWEGLWNRFCHAITPDARDTMPLQRMNACERLLVVVYRELRTTKVGTAPRRETNL